MSRDILVTGAAGTLGAPLVKRLRELGHNVWELDLFHRRGVFRCDVSDYRQLERAYYKAGSPDFVYHLAAEFGRHNGEDYYEQCWRTNAIGTKNMIRLQEREGFEMVFTSSSEVYGEPAALPIPEDTLERHPVHLHNDYAMSKWVNEQQIKNSQIEWNTATMVLRLFNAYGPGERYHSYRSVVCLFIDACLKNRPITLYEDYHRVFQYVDDLVETLAGCVDNFYAGETINVGGEEYCSVERMLDLVVDAVGREPLSVMRLPKEQLNVTNKMPDITKAKKLLKHRPTTLLVDGIPKTVEWMRAEMDRA